MSFAGIMFTLFVVLTTEAITSGKIVSAIIWAVAATIFALAAMVYVDQIKDRIKKLEDRKGGKDNDR